MLHTFYHVEQICEDEFDGGFFSFHIGCTNCDQQVETRNHRACVLDGFVQVSHFASFLVFIYEVLFELVQLVKYHHICKLCQYLQSL